MNWTVEAGTPQLNVRHDRRYDDVMLGDKVTVEIYPARDGTSRGSLEHIMLADGRSLRAAREFLTVPPTPADNATLGSSPST
ncbi:MAG: DUF6152 family protein [Steroidobacteraceae bacterium]